MNEEPFGPLTTINGSTSLEEAIRLECRLAAYAFKRWQRDAVHLGDELECGMVSVNDDGLAYTEVPFNGVKGSD